MISLLLSTPDQVGGSVTLSDSLRDFVRKVRCLVCWSLDMYCGNRSLLAAAAEVGRWSLLNCLGRCFFMHPAADVLGLSWTVAFQSPSELRVTCFSLGPSQRRKTCLAASPIFSDALKNRFSGLSGWDRTNCDPNVPCDENHRCCARKTTHKTKRRGYLE